MTKSLKETLIFVAFLPLAVGGLMLYLGAGLYSFLAAFVLMKGAEIIVQRRKANAVLRGIN